MKRVHDGETENACQHAGGGLGDLMGGGEHHFWGTASSVAMFSPMERVLLSANGNLQRLVSSYLNAPVTVATVYNRRTGHGQYEREVTLTVHAQQFAVCTSTVTLSREDCIDAVERRGVAIGQMFRHLNIMPRFTLHKAGEQADGRWWREYTLEAEGCCCRIREVLLRGLLELEPPAEPAPPAPDSEAVGGAAGAPAPAAPPAPPPAPPPAGTFGDIMSASATGISLPDGFSGKQRLLLTANGNVERIVRAYYDEEVSLHVLEHVRRARGVYERKVSMHVRGSEFMTARSTVYLTAADWVEAAEQQRVPVSELFGHMGVLPTFTLHSAGRGCGEPPGHFWRVYSLRSAGMCCEITETYAADVLDRDEERYRAKRTSSGHGF